MPMYLFYVCLTLKQKKNKQKIKSENEKNVKVTLKHLGNKRSSDKKAKPELLDLIFSLASFNQSKKDLPYE